MKISYRIALITTFTLCGSAAFATEGGGSTYIPGGDIFLQGAVPPPGFYVLQYGNVTEATKLKGSDGNTLPVPGFKARVAATATRLVWSTPYQFAGGNLVLHGILPLVDLKVSAAGASEHRSGLGDVTFGPGLATHYSEHLHSVIGVDFIAPTGGYTRGNLANIGRNYWSVTPLYAMSYTDPSGFNGDFKANLNINRRNADTGYTSGKEFILDFTAGHAVAPGWIAGVSGYFYRQISDDRLNGAAVPNARARSMALGPAFKYDNGKGWLFTAKLQKEFSARNRSEGASLILKTAIPF